MNRSTRTLIRATTTSVLLSAATLHVAWGRGSTFPYQSAEELTDNVVGSPRAPSKSACYGVAATLAATAAIVAVDTNAAWLHRLRRIVAVTFAVRAGFGLAGRTDVLVPGSSSPAFRHRDRLVYAPICAAIRGRHRQPVMPGCTSPDSYANTTS